MKRNRKKRMKKKTAAGIIVSLLLSASAMAVDPNAPPPPMLHTITELRMKQEQEENSVIRVIQQPVMLQTEQVCSPVEQARQRIREVGRSEEKFAGTVTVEAGHGEVAIDNNSGTVNNDVNVQVVNPNERLCP